MSLNWDCEQCAKPLPDNDEEAALRTALIWASVGLDMGSITEDNVDEWVFRLMYQKRAGCEFIYLDDSTGPSELEQIVRRWVGMVTNVIPKTRKKWMASISAMLERDTLREIADTKAAL